jgi:hypothetical protein
MTAECARTRRPVKQTIKQKPINYVRGIVPIYDLFIKRRRFMVPDSNSFINPRHPSHFPPPTSIPPINVKLHNIVIITS